MKSHPLEIPYRLETIEDINSAMKKQLIEETDYKRLLHFAREKTFEKPQALTKARKKATKEFIRVDEEKIKDVQVSFSEAAHLPLISQHPLIIESMPWINDIIRHENLFEFFHAFPPDIRKRLLIEQIPELPTAMYAAVLAIRKLLKKELIVYVKAHGTATLSLIQLKKSLVALTVFDPANDDVLLGLKTKKKSEDSPLHHHAVAEILFARLPQMIQGMLSRNPNNLAPKLSAKMSSLNLSSRHIMNLMGYIRKNMTSDEFHKALNRMEGVAMKLPIPRESQNKLHHYIDSIKKNMDRAPSVYQALFLSPELETCRKLYRPGKVMQQVTTVTEKIIKQWTIKTTLNFYPCKDFFELIKSKYSSDCTDTYLGDRQLMTPHFFNIRIFKEEKWIGNIYMLDFCVGYDSLIVDRIQIPREEKALFHQFFYHLKELLVEIFEDVPYRYILMPLAISNHETIQKIWNEYKNNLKKKIKLIDTIYSVCFESLRRRSYYVLHEKSDEKQTALKKDE